jgi:type II secretory pathway pseudopilin PulG
MPSQRLGGFTILELLLSVAMTAVLLTAVAAAMHASSQSYMENEKVATTCQMARMVLSRMAQEIRTANNVLVPSSSKIVIVPASGSNIEYELVSGVFYYRRGAESYPLLTSSDEITLTSFAPSREILRDDQGQPVVEGGNSVARSATARLVLTAGSYTLPVSASSTLRMRQSY